MRLHFLKKLTPNLVDKIFYCIIYGQMAVIYRTLPISEEICGQNLTEIEKP